jgi:hypothetical protein
MYSNITGKPGVQATFTAVPRSLFYGNRQDARFIPGPVTVDGTLSSNPQNTPYTWLLFAGQPVGKVTATGKYATSIMGLSTAAIAAAGTSLTTDVNTAAEVLRRVGIGGTITLAGPAVANTAPVNSETATVSAVNTGTGVITLSAGTTHAYVSGSLIQPADGSQTIVTLICDLYGNKVVDCTNTVRVDVYDAQLWAGGGIVDEGYIVGYPTDTAIQAYLKAAIRAGIPSALFRNDLINS